MGKKILWIKKLKRKKSKNILGLRKIHARNNEPLKNTWHTAILLLKIPKASPITTVRGKFIA